MNNTPEPTYEELANMLEKVVNESENFQQEIRIMRQAQKGYQAQQYRASLFEIGPQIWKDIQNAPDIEAKLAVVRPLLDQQVALHGSKALFDQRESLLRNWLKSQSDVDQWAVLAQNVFKEADVMLAASQEETLVIAVLIAFDQQILTAYDGDHLAEILPDWRDWILQSRDRWYEIFHTTGHTPIAEQPERVAQIENRLAAIGQILDSDNDQDKELGWDTLYKIAGQSNPIRDQVYKRNRERLEMIKQQSFDAGTEAARLAHLPADQLETIRVKGLIKWAIEHIIANRKKDGKKATAELLLDRLETNFKQGNISPTDEKTVYHDLKTRLEGTRSRQSISDVMNEKVKPVAWDKVSIRLD